MTLWDISNTANAGTKPTTKDKRYDAFTLYSRLPLPTATGDRHRSGAARGNQRGAAVSREDKEALVDLLLYVGRWIIGTIVVCVIILLAVALAGDTPRDHVGPDEEYHARQGRRLAGGGL